MQIFKGFSRSFSWLYLRLAQGALILLILGAVWMLVHQEFPARFDTVAVQSRMEQHDAIGAWVEEHPVAVPQSADPHYKLGAWFAESVALTISKKHDAARQRLARIQTLAENTAQLRRILDTIPQAMQRNDKSALIYIFRMLQEELQSQATSKGPDQALLFHWGGWLVDVSLIGAMHDDVIVIPLHNMLIRQARFFNDHLPRPQTQEPLRSLIEAFGAKPLHPENFQIMLQQAQSLQQSAAESMPQSMPTR